MRTIAYASLVTALMAVFGVFSAPAQSIDLPQFFENARQARDAMPPQAFDSQAADYINNDPLLAAADPAQIAVYAVSINGGQYDVTSTTYRADATGAMIPNVESRRFWDGERSWGRSKFIADGQSRAIVKGTKESRRRLLHDQDAGAFLEGRFLHNFDGDWIEILENEPDVSLASALEDIEGHPCLVLSASTPHGQYDLWIDPNAGYRIRRGLITVGSEDLAWGTPLLDSPNRAPHHRITQIEMEITNVLIETIGDFDMSTGGTLTTKFYYDDDTVSHVVKEVDRDNVVLNPDFAAMNSFKVDLAEGSIITYWFEGDIRLKYVWGNDQLTPWIEEFVLEDIEGDLADLVALSVDGGTGLSIVDEDHFALAGILPSSSGPGGGSGYGLVALLCAIAGVLLVTLQGLRSYSHRTRGANV